MWNLKKPPKLIETKQMGGSQRRGQGVGEMGVGGEEVQTSRYKILPFVTTWMDLEVIMLSEISQKDKYCMISLIHVNFKNKNKKPSS